MWQAIPFRQTLRLLALGLLALSLSVPSMERCCLGQTPASASGRWPALANDQRDWMGTLSCASASCHGQDPETVPGISLGGKWLHQESTIWEEHDPHARAARILDTAEFRRILTRVSGQAEDAPFDPVVYRQCAACHDPAGIAALDHATRQGLAAPDRRAAPRGVGCESCHGAAQDWLTSHYQGNFTAERRQAAGMIDTRDLLTRGRVCAQCHVGDERHDMNHDMIAAGHPPLRFELTSYHDLIRVKHWRESARTAVSEFKFQMWLAGRWAVADATLGLLADRAARSLPPKTSNHKSTQSEGVWPELAEYDCFACHQRLRVGERQAAQESRLSREPKLSAIPRWQPWNLSSWRGGVLPGSPVKLDQALLELRATMSANLDSDPAVIQAQAQAARQLLRSTAFPGVKLPPRLGELVVIDEADSAAAGAASDSSASFTARDYLQRLVGVAAAAASRPANADAAESRNVDRWADACQDYLAVKAAYQAWRERAPAGRLATEGRLVPGDATGSVLRGSRDAADLERRLTEIAQSLQFGSTEFEWPGYDWKGLAGTPISGPLPSLSAIREQLRSVAEQLLRSGND